MATLERLAARYLLTRLLLVIPMVWILLTVVFVLMRVAPGDPVQAALGGRLPPADHRAAAARRAASTSRSSSQYCDYLGGVLHGDFGTLDHRQPHGARASSRTRARRRSS